MLCSRCSVSDCVGGPNIALHCIALRCIGLHWVTLHCIGLIPILGWGQTSGAHSGKQSSGWSNGFPLDAAKVDRDGSTRQLDVFHCNVRDMG